MCHRGAPRLMLPRNSDRSPLSLRGRQSVAARGALMRQSERDCAQTAGPEAPALQRQPGDTGLSC